MTVQRYILILNMNVTDCTSIRDSMEYYENRLKTFDTYPKQILRDKIQLARAGLYYTGKSDVCQCFRCHVKLSAWEQDVDAIKEHYKWLPQCEYIKLVGAPPPRPPEYRFGSSAPSFSGFGTGSSNMVKPLDPKGFHIYRENRDEPL